MAISVVPDGRGVTASVVTIGEFRQTPFGRWQGHRDGSVSVAVRTLAASGVVAALALSGCGSTSGPRTAPTSPNVSVPQLDARAAAEASALEAYRGMWRAYAEAAADADPESPGLTRYSAGDALTTLREGLESLRRDGQVVRGELVSDPEVADASPSTTPAVVSVIDCLDTNGFLTTYQASGDPVDDEPGGRRLTRATVTDLGTAEGWKVTGLGVQAVGTCG